MINNQYSMEVKDIKTYKDMKDSPMYRDYIQDIVHSPIFRMITKEHIDDIDVSDDLEALQSAMKLNPKELNKVFKKALSKMAVGIAADTVIMKEITDLKVEDVKSDIDSNFKIKYLLGLADKKYYKKAEKILKENPDTNSVLYKGLAEFSKVKDIPSEKLNLEDRQPKKPKSPIKTTPRTSSKKIDIGSSTIRL